MKKIMIALGAVALAIGVQAASVNWSSGRIYLPGDGGNGWSSEQVSKSETAYTFTLAIYASYTGGVLGDAITLTGNTATSTGSTSANRMYKGAAEFDGSLSSTSSYYLYAEIVRNSDGAKLTSQVMEMVWDGGMTNPSVNFMGTDATGVTKWTSADGGTFNSTYGYWNSTGWTAAPEPTSGMLLLLGVAGLALRRKRA